MEIGNNFFKCQGIQSTSSKIKTDVNTNQFSDIKPKQKAKKKTCSLIRKNLLSIVKEDIKDSKELIIKSYKEDVNLEKLNTNHSLNIINTENYDDDIQEINDEEKLDLEYSKNKYAGKNYSSSNMND